MHPTCRSSSHTHLNHLCPEVQTEGACPLKLAPEKSNPGCSSLEHIMGWKEIMMVLLTNVTTVTSLYVTIILSFGPVATVEVQDRDMLGTFFHTVELCLSRGLFPVLPSLFPSKWEVFFHLLSSWNLSSMSFLFTSCSLNISSCP